MNHILPHPITMTMLINYINKLLKNDWAQIGMNHTSGQFYHYIFIFRGFSHSHEGGSESSASNQEVTIMVPNKRAQ